MDSDTPCPDFTLNVEMSRKLGELVKEFDDSYGTSNGSTALYWHLVSVFALHYKTVEVDDHEPASTPSVR